MAANPYLDSSPWSLRPPSSAEVKPQYVHHLAPHLSPEISDMAPKHKDVKQRCTKFTVAAVISLLLLLLLAGILLIYYYSSPCMHGLECGDGSCVWDSQWCNGVTDCPAGQDEANCVRVYGSSFQLQIYSSQSKSWKSVCSPGWSDAQGRASCMQMGYHGDTYFESGQQQTNIADGFLNMKSNFNPDASLLQQLVLSNTCPENSVVTLRCTDCGRGVNSSRALDQLISLGSWPWQISLQVGGSHRCGGAVISPFWIVTVAHCVVGVSSDEDWTVYAGIVDLQATLSDPYYSVSSIRVHEGFNNQTRQNDIALIRLSQPLDNTILRNVGPVCLPNAGLNFTADQEGWVTYFSGRVTGESNSLPLMEAQVSLIDTRECNSSIAYNSKISQDMLCARDLEMSDNLCETDSGSPLAVLHGGVWWLIGNNIMEPDCTEPNKLSVYNNIPLALDWIFQQMRTQQED